MLLYSNVHITFKLIHRFTTTTWINVLKSFPLLSGTNYWKEEEKNQINKFVIINWCQLSFTSNEFSFALFLFWFERIAYRSINEVLNERTSVNDQQERILIWFHSIWLANSLANDEQIPRSILSIEKEKKKKENESPSRYTGQWSNSIQRSMNFPVDFQQPKRYNVDFKNRKKKIERNVIRWIVHG